MTVDGERTQKAIPNHLTASTQSDNKDNKLADVLTDKEQKILPLGKSLKQHLIDRPGKPVTDPTLPD